jgi:hypothetical protein
VQCIPVVMSFVERLRKEGWWWEDHKIPSLVIDDRARKALEERGFVVVRDSEGAFVKITVLVGNKPLSELSEDDIKIERLPIAAYVP